MLKFLQAGGIGTGFVSEISNRTVGLYLTTLNGAERSFTFWRNASAARLLAKDGQALYSALGQANVIYFSGVTLAILSPAHRKIFLAVLQELKMRNVIIAFDTNIRRRLWPSTSVTKKALIDGYKVSTIALPTFDDESALFKDATPADCIKRIEGYGVQEIAVKDGSKPSCITQ